MPRRPDNAAVLSSSEGIIVSVSRLEQMKLYDALPARYRALVDAAPIEQNVAEVHEVLNLHGSLAWDLICFLWEQNFPGWRRPEK